MRQNIFTHLRCALIQSAAQKYWLGFWWKKLLKEREPSCLQRAHKQEKEKFRDLLLMVNITAA
jgi:hypothetical protein